VDQWAWSEDKKSGNLRPFFGDWSIFATLSAPIGCDEPGNGAPVWYGLASLDIWHCDVQLIDYRQKVGCSSVNGDELDMVLWIPDLFMKRLGENADWSPFDLEDVGNLHDLDDTECAKFAPNWRKGP
jgi:hypothetical protein